MGLGLSATIDSAWVAGVPSGITVLAVTGGVTASVSLSVALCLRNCVKLQMETSAGPDGLPSASVGGLERGKFFGLCLPQLFPLSDALVKLTTLTGVAVKLHLIALGDDRPE